MGAASQKRLTTREWLFLSATVQQRDDHFMGRPKGANLACWSTSFSRGVKVPIAVLTVIVVEIITVLLIIDHEAYDTHPPLFSHIL